jgi:hypothetical protein
MSTMIVSGWRDPRSAGAATHPRGECGCSATGMSPNRGALRPPQPSQHSSGTECIDPARHHRGRRSTQDTTPGQGTKLPTPSERSRPLRLHAGNRIASRAARRWCYFTDATLVIVLALGRAAGGKPSPHVRTQPIDDTANSDGPAALEYFDALLLFGEPALTRSQFQVEAVDLHR